jgi:pyruvate dehydrogenase E1 component alpha subunit
VPQLRHYASINKLATLFVCENNYYATESPMSVRQPAGTELCQRVGAFKIATESIDGNDVTAVYDAATRAVAHMRAGKGPYFIECETYRWLEHVGPMYDHELNRTYRSREEVEAWKARCPVRRGAARLLERKLATQAELDRWMAETRAEMEEVVAKAKASPWPEVSGLFENVW